MNVLALGGVLGIGATATTLGLGPDLSTSTLGSSVGARSSATVYLLSSTNVAPAPSSASDERRVTSIGGTPAPSARSSTSAPTANDAVLGFVGVEPVSVEE